MPFKDAPLPLICCTPVKWILPACCELLYTHVAMTSEAYCICNTYAAAWNPLRSFLRRLSVLPTWTEKKKSAHNLICRKTVENLTCAFFVSPPLQCPEEAACCGSDSKIKEMRGGLRTGTPELYCQSNHVERELLNSASLRNIRSSPMHDVKSRD